MINYQRMGANYMFGADPDNEAARQGVITRVLTVASAIFLCAMMVLTFADVIGRYFLNAPINGAHEFIAFLLGLTVFTAFPLVTKDRQHITVGLFDRFFKGRIRFIQRLGVLLATFAVVGFVAFLMYDQAETMREAAFLTEYLDLPLAPIVYVLAGLTGLASLIFAGTIWSYLRAGGDPEDKAPRQEPAV